MRKKDNIRYDVHHPGSAFPLCRPFLVFHWVMLVFIPSSLTFPTAFRLQFSISRYHTLVIVHDDLQHG